MLCKDLKVVSLDISEANYEYKVLFRLCTESACLDVDLEKFSENGTLEEIKKTFSIDESIDEIRKIIMDKVMEATELESIISEGENCCKDTEDKKIQRSIDSLNMS